MELNKHSEIHDRKSTTCDKSNILETKEKEKEKHFDEKYEELQYNCEECPFQGTTQIQLNKHFNLKHMMKGQTMKEVIQCKHCNEQFSAIWNLMSHRKQEHPNTVAFCKNKPIGTCRFNADTCWWRHEEKETGQQVGGIKCFICNQNFETKADMMIHRKCFHRSMVRKCTDFLKNQCRFQEKFCWFVHDNEDMEIDNNIETENDPKEMEDNEINSVFQKAKGDLKPPEKKSN